MKTKFSMDIKEEMDLLVSTNPMFNHLYLELQAKYKIKVFEISYVEDDTTTKNWTCESKENEFIINAPLKNRDIESFVHEVLHVHLDSKGFSDNKVIIDWVTGLKHPIPYLFADTSLLAHINNSLAHYKMYPIYFDLGYSKEKFTGDFQNCPVNKDYMDEIDSNFYNSSLPNDCIGMYIAQFISCRYCLNDSFATQYTECLQKLRTKNEELFDICESFLQKWTITSEKYNLPHIIKFAYEVRDWRNENKNKFIGQSTI